MQYWLSISVFQTETSELKEVHFLRIRHFRRQVKLKQIKYFRDQSNSLRVPRSPTESFGDFRWDVLNFELTDLELSRDVYVDFYFLGLRLSNVIIIFLSGITRLLQGDNLSMSRVILSHSIELQKLWKEPQFEFLRANVTNGQTFSGNRSKINSAQILMVGRP